jgi:hypothetical protein
LNLRSSGSRLETVRDNANLNRVLLRQGKYEADLKRIQRYLLYYRFLTDEISEEVYRSLMAPLD